MREIIKNMRVGSSSVLLNYGYNIPAMSFLEPNISQKLTIYAEILLFHSRNFFAVVI